MIKIDIWTLQIAQWRKLPKEIAYLDTTVKSGCRQLAPVWSMVMAHKAGEVSDEQYTDLFNDLMDKRINDRPSAIKAIFTDLLEDKKGIALACYCRKGAFCHRLLLARTILPKYQDTLGIEFTYKGEVE